MKKIINKNKKNKKSSKASRNLPFARMLFIDKEIAKGDYPSAPFLAKKYGGVYVPPHQAGIQAVPRCQGI